MDNFKGKRLLILGGAVQHLKVVKAAKELGVYTIVTDIKKGTETKMIADEQLDISVMDSEGLMRWCYIHPVDGILNFCVDYAQHSHERLCHEFGFPCYGTVDQYNILTDKKLFKEFCKKNGVGVIPDYRENDLDNVKFPVLVKPAESSGSRGSFICNTNEELYSAVNLAKKESRNCEIIIEKYMFGYPDLEIVYMVINMRPWLIYVGDRFLGRKEDNLNRQCVGFVGPSRYLEKYLRCAHKKVCHMIEKLGIVNSPVFFQGFIDGDIVRLYDPGIRFPGDEFNSIIKEATGTDLMSALVKYSLFGSTGLDEKKLDKIYYMNGYQGALWSPPAGQGTITIFDGLDNILKLPSTVSAVQKHFVNDEIFPTGDVNQRICEIAIMVNGDRAELKNAVDKTKSFLRVEDQFGKNQLVSDFDTNMLM